MKLFLGRGVNLGIFYEGGYFVKFVGRGINLVIFLRRGVNLVYRIGFFVKGGGRKVKKLMGMDSKPLK